MNVRHRWENDLDANSGPPIRCAPPSKRGFFAFLGLSRGLTPTGAPNEDTGLGPCHHCGRAADSVRPENNLFSAARTQCPRQGRHEPVRPECVGHDGKNGLAYPETETKSRSLTFSN